MTVTITVDHPDLDEPIQGTNAAPLEDDGTLLYDWNRVAVGSRMILRRALEATKAEVTDDDV